MLNSRMAAVLRRTVGKFLKDTCDITVDNVTLDAYGGKVVTQVPVALSVPCRVIRAGAPSGTLSGLVGSQESMSDTNRIIVPRGTAVAIDQRITVSGETYNVIALVTALTDDMFETVIVTRQR